MLFSKQKPCLVNGLHSVHTFVEKPAPEEAPSDLAIIGRYLLTPEIFTILEKQEPGAGDEIQQLMLLTLSIKRNVSLLVNLEGNVMMLEINLALLKQLLITPFNIHRSKIIWKNTSSTLVNNFKKILVKRINVIKKKLRN